MSGRRNLRRDWRAAEEVLRSVIPRCRVCGSAVRLERAHTVDRARDPRGAGGRVVAPHSVIWLCLAHHAAYDAHELDLYPLLTDEERRVAVQLAGGPGNALRRLCGPLWRQGDSQAVRTLDERLEALILLS